MEAKQSRPRQTQIKITVPQQNVFFSMTSDSSMYSVMRTRSNSCCSGSVCVCGGGGDTCQVGRGGVRGHVVVLVDRQANTGLNRDAQRGKFPGKKQTPE